VVAPQPAGPGSTDWGRQHELVPELAQLVAVDGDAHVVFGPFPEDLLVDANSVRTDLEKSRTAVRRTLRQELDRRCGTRLRQSRRAATDGYERRRGGRAGSGAVGVSFVAVPLRVDRGI